MVKKICFLLYKIDFANRMWTHEWKENWGWVCLPQNWLIVLFFPTVHCWIYELCVAKYFSGVWVFVPDKCLASESRLLALKWAVGPTLQGRKFEKVSGQWYEKLAVPVTLAVSFRERDCWHDGSISFGSRRCRCGLISLWRKRARAPILSACSTPTLYVAKFPSETCGTNFTTAQILPPQLSHSPPPQKKTHHQHRSSTTTLFCLWFLYLSPDCFICPFFF